jgi:hypothetical protein
MSGVVVRPFSPIILGVSGAASSAGANTTENTLATVTIPGGLMGANGILRVTTLWTMTNSANNKTITVKLGGTAGTAYCNLVLGTGIASARYQHQIQNANSQASQVGFVSANTVGFGTAAGANVTSSIDTSATTTLVITGTKASSGEVLTLQSYLVELLRQ